MTPSHFVFQLTCLLLVNVGLTKHHVSSAVRQKSGLMEVKAGDTLTLECFYDPLVSAKFYWYKLTLGQKLQLISSFFKYETNVTFYNEFQNNQRFSLDSEKGKNHLTISKLQPSDTATYYCSKSSIYDLEFANGMTVIVEGSGSNIQTLVHQSEAETLQPGGSVTLTCTVQTGSCDEEDNVYWFRNSEEYFPGLLYPQGHRNNDCGKRPLEQTRTCLYNLPLKNLNISNAGTYYCAVASCGRIVFGNGTKLGFQDRVNSLYFIGGALAFTSFLSILQAFLLFRIYRRRSSEDSESCSRLSQPYTTTAEGVQDEENLEYTGLRLQKVYTSTRQRNEKTDCVYSSIKK